MTAHPVDVLTRLRRQVQEASTDDEAAELAIRIQAYARRLRASRWSPYEWQHPHIHPDGWVSTRDQGDSVNPPVCDESCHDLPAATIPTQGMWLDLGGRGTGKTEGASHYVNTHAEGPPCDTRLPGGHRIVIVAPTQGDTVEACVTGPSGLQTINPGIRLTTSREGTVVRWPNRARARLLGAHTPDDVNRLRAAGNSCIATGTLIRTDRGLVPVEDVKPGDLVPTRTGWRPVVRAEHTGHRPVLHVTGPGVDTWVTPDHPVALAAGGFTEAGHLDRGKVLVWHEQRPSPTTDRPGTAEPPATGQTPALASSTATSTPRKSAPSRTGGTSTTGTTTAVTTLRGISSPSTPWRTAPSTDPRTETGTSPVDGPPPSPAPRRLPSVSSAEQSGPHSEQPTPPGSVAPGAGTPGLRHEHGSTGCAACAEEGSPPAAGPAPAPVPRHVARSRPTRHADVYDLAVDGHHEFYAGGLLVGNCLVWLEEVAAQRHLGEVLKHTALGLRIGDHPHYVASTTPLPRPEVINLVTDPRTVLTRGRTRDAHRLDPVVRAVYEEKWGGTTAGRTELDGELLRSVPGALWVPERMPGEEAPADDERPAIVRVPAGAVGYTSHNTDDPGPTAPILVHRTVVSVDPNAGGDDEAGIHVIGAIDRTAYVLADLSGNMTSDRWARTAVQAYYDYGAEGIALEKSGGDAPSTIIRSITLDDGRTGAGVPIFLMPTKVGKRLRAEPVQAVSQQGRLIMVGSFPKTESQMTTWVPDVDPDSPDRVDSLVHGVTYLIIRNAPATTANPAHATRRINRRR